MPYQSFSYRYSEGGDESDARLMSLFSGGGVPAKPTGDAVDTETIYKMSRAPRGIAIIINNKNFLRSSGMDKYPRNGTDVDRDALEKLFKYLNFEVRIYNDVTTDGICRIAQEMAALTDHSDYDAFIFSILTHGEEGVLYGTDGTISTRDITSKFKDATTLAGKPKMFFFQACQGKKSVVPCNVHLISFAVPLSLSRSCVNWFAFVLFHWKLFDIQVKGCLSGSVEGVKSNINDDNNKKLVIIIIIIVIRMIINASSGKSCSWEDGKSKLISPSQLTGWRLGRNCILRKLSRSVSSV